MADSNVVPFSPVATPKGEPDPLLNIEMGVEKVLPFTYWSTDGEIARQSNVSLDDMVEMRRRDGQARALMRLFTLPILSAMATGEWIAPDEEDGDGMDEEVQFANDMWNASPTAGGMTTSKMVMLKKTLQALVDGFAVFEEVRQIPDDGPLKGKITLRKLAYRDPRTIRFRVDETGGFNGIRQIASVNGKTVDVKIPKDKCFFWTVNAEENPFYGVSMFEAAYYHYEIKRKLYYIAHLAAQFAAVPGRIGTIPAGADPRQVNAFKQSLMNFAFNTAMVKQADYEVDPFNGNSGFDFLALIDHHNHQMSKSVVASFLDQEARTTLVDLSSSDPNTDFFVMALESLMDDLAEHWSMYLMPKYINWNFPDPAGYPVFKFGKLSDAAKEAINTMFQTVVTSTVLNSTPEFVREMEKKISAEFDLPIDYDEIEKQEKEAAEKQAADAAVAQAGPMAPGAPQPGPPQPGQQPQQPAAAPPAPGAPGGPPAPPQDDMAPLSGAPVTLDDLFQQAAALMAQLPDDEDQAPV